MSEMTFGLPSLDDSMDQTFYQISANSYYQQPTSSADAGGTPGTTSGGSGSAAAVIKNVLDGYGLGELAQWAWKRYLAGDSTAEIMLKLREQPAYIERFPAMAELGKKGRALSEGQYIEYERAVARSAANFGIPDGIYTSRQAIANLMLKDWSPVEIDAQMRHVAGVIYGQPAIRQAFARFYGADGDGAAIAFFLDPDYAIPELERKYQAVQIAGNAMANGLDISRRDAERIAQIANPTDAEAQRAGVIAGTQRELFSNLIGEVGGPDAATGIGAVLGVSAADVDKVEGRRAERKAAYAEGGTYAAGASGVAGLGSANR